MNPKEVSYSHPQLPLCDTPIYKQIRPFTVIETQKYGFLEKMQARIQKNVHPYPLFSTCLRKND